MCGEILMEVDCIIKVVVVCVVVWLCVGDSVGVFVLVV